LCCCINIPLLFEATVPASPQDLSITHERWGASDHPSKNSQLRYPDDHNKSLWEAFLCPVLLYQSAYASNYNISFLPSIFSTSGSILGVPSPAILPRSSPGRDSDEFFRPTGQLAQPNQDCVFSKLAAFFNSHKSRVGHIIAKTTALSQPQPHTFCPLSSASPCTQILCPSHPRP